MRTTSSLALASTAMVVRAASLSDICTTSYVSAALPVTGFYTGITINPDSLTVNAVANTTVTGQDFFPDATFDYCNVTFTYSHDGLNDSVTNNFWLPAPSKFQNRYLSTGGGGLAINSGDNSLPAGIIYGAVAGKTDGGFGGFGNNLDAEGVMILANGTLNWHAVKMFGYQAHKEMSAIGKQLAKNVFSMNGTKLYAYYQACSEGGREGWSQVQRFADEWDGAITGAPALRFAHQQVQHLYSGVVEKTIGYSPPPCELEKIVNATIAFCDPLDGKTDGVVARTDLCKLQFNINSTIGLPYYCAASSPSGPFGKRQVGAASTPAQNGNVTAQGVAVASKIIDGLKDSTGKRAYLSYQPAASFEDATTSYNSATGEWEVAVSGLGSEFPVRFLEELDADNFEAGQFANVTYDTLRDWMFYGWQKFEETLQTTWPDITPFQQAGGKVLHFHGESDNSIPTASSVHWYESVRSIMYPDLSFNESTTALNDWYRLFLVPGAAHCQPNSLQPNGPWPQTSLAVLIDWVENGNSPETLNATVLQGDFKGQEQDICSWPLRPMWSGNGTSMACEYDQASIDTWMYDFDAFKLPVY
ncbi:alpha/beta-Hydrolase [Glarea lozoyensis ATCC 20868]|uniref:Carboxylic ester hydrolase n=2 Tax=Glarea lozoyensis TaxID=101852 RepID=S3CMS5_GLAL2|nr:alpha/beta-Hydrolase [Glarea lozoyensis ATCC 20868]EHL00674.1 putative Tannase [Glarea lozoyensis 74030]EPE27035.1 alpha/beta-Hydrolase [Glarea lozoyensis ATCC 20868]